MPHAQSSTVLSTMRRFQRSALFGGGIVLTVLALVTFGIAVASMIRAHVNSEQRELAIEGRRIASDVMLAEMTLRSTVYMTELVWSQHAAVATGAAARFQADGARLIRQSEGAQQPVLFAGVTPQTIVPDFDRVIALADRVSRVLAQQRYPFTSYLYTPSRDFVAALLSPWPDQAHLDAALANRPAFFDAFTQDANGSIAPATIDDPRTGLRTVRWIEPYRNPLTGVSSIRLSIHALDTSGKPFGILVTEIPLGFMLRALSADRFAGTFAVVGRDGALITTSAGDDVSADIVAAVREASSGAANGIALHRASNGVFTASGPFGTTGWRLVYASTWRDALVGVWPQVLLTMVLTAGLITALWILLWWFNRRVFVPMLERSERVVETERLNRMLIETAPIGLGVIDANTGEPMLRSPVMADIAQQVKVGAPSLSAELAQRYAKRTRTGVMRDDLVLATQEGGQIDLAVNLAPAHYRNTNVLVTAFTDITAKKRIELALREAKQAADNANRAKSVFLATMSHEIRTPLNAILGNLELIQRMPLQPAVSERLQTVTSSSNALLGIINDVLDFSKIEAGQLSIESIPFDAAAVVRDVAAIFAPVAHEKGLQFDCVVDDSVAPAYLGDPTRIRQIASNLLSNAIKFTEQGDVLIEIWGREDAAGKPGVAIGVSDSGIGISAEQQARLFAPFVQADSTITRRFGGSGLGLALCRRLVELMGGAIDMQSAPGEGSRFVVTLPCTPIEATAEVPGDAAPMPSSGDMQHGRQGLRILAADDQAANRELIRMQLEALGYRVDMAADGGEALRRFNEQHYDLVLTDLNMPGMDGYALARCLRAQGAKVPIAALTANAEVEEHQRSAQAGIDAVLVKPVLLKTLDAKLRRMLHTAIAVPAAPRPAPRQGIGEGPLPDAILAALSRSTGEQLAALRVALSTDDRKIALRDLHAMKGTYAMIHEQTVSDACAAMEQQVKQGDDLAGLQPALDHLASLTQEALTRRSA
jgi:two-component system capsular synthesis sensor histidine kinase RcsC